MSWDDTKIITAGTVKTLTNFDANVEDRKLEPSIYDAQHDLKQTLGETLYGQIEDADPVNDATLDGNTALATLYNSYAKKFLAWKTIAHAYMDLMAGATRNGVFVKQGDQYAPVDGKTLSALQGKADARAEARRGELIRYVESLADTNAIRVAYETDVNYEPRSKEVKNTGRIITRVSYWQNPDRQ
jgi:hypothetical protein